MLQSVTGRFSMPKFSPRRGNTTISHCVQDLLRLYEHEDVFLSVKQVNIVNEYRKK